MDLEEKMRLVKRNTVEIIEEGEIEQILKEKKKPVTYCGYEPSGEVHLGHMVTATKLTDLEKAGFKVTVLLADVHAWINKKGDWDFIHGQCRLWEKAFKAMGLKNAEYALGSSFQRKANYVDDYIKLSLNTTVSRAMRSMQEIARDYEHATVSQMIYPLMQIADIKHLNVDVAQAGIEQRKIHMLAREELPNIGYKKPSLVHTPLINSLKGPGQKMSSSIPDSMVSVRDSEDDIRRKISGAYCNPGEVEGNPVLEIAKLIVFPQVKGLEVQRAEKFGGNVSYANYEDLERDFAAKKLHPMDLKNAISGQLVEILEPVRKVFK